MQYDYQYAICSVFISFVLIAANYLRHSYSSKKNRVFACLLFANLVCALMDLITFPTISNPEIFSTFVRYLPNVLYLWVYGFLACTFACYVAYVSENKKLIEFTREARILVAIFEGAILLLTPVNHWIIYFSSDLTYTHGPFMWVMFVIPIALNIYIIIATLISGTKLSRFQKNSIVAILFAMLLCMAVQYFVPRADLGNLFLAAVTLFIFFAFENPAAYMYRNTNCLNRAAFEQSSKEMRYTFDEIDLFIIGVYPLLNGLELNKSIISAEFPEKIAEMFCKDYKRNAYCIDEDTFVLVQMGLSKKEKLDLMTKIEARFICPLDVNGIKVRAHCSVQYLNASYLKNNNISIQTFVDMLMLYSSSEIDKFESISAALKQYQRSVLVEQSIDEAIENNSFTVVYQPIFNIEKERFESAEALVRLRTDGLGYIGPGEFIPLAERKGKIADVGNAVLQQVLEFLKSGRAFELGIHYIEVNVSVLQLMEPFFAKNLINSLNDASLPTSCINLEITESEHMVTNETVRHNLSQLTNAGIVFSLDDYGTGFSSSDYLFRLPFSMVKVDKSILWRAMEDEQARIVFENICVMFRRLKREIVVEGVETPEMVDFVKRNHCDYIQGYYYSRPIVEEKFLEFLRQHNR
jgi:EAL domain-containing protein (putative c-di-GMP-specific phosphodiesterase class I)